MLRLGRRVRAKGKGSVIRAWVRVSGQAQAQVQAQAQAQGLWLRLGSRLVGAVPANPEEESTQNLQRGVMSWHADWTPPPSIVSYWQLHVANSAWVAQP